MSGISKRVNGSWVSGDERVMKTATDTLTTLPADLYADGNNATVGLVGNMSQTGTPTPQNPIQPQETGERTGNLWSSGNVTVALHGRYKPITVSVESGLYTLSFDYESENTGTVTIIFYNASDILQTFNVTIINGKGAATINTAQPITTIRLYSAAGYSISYDYAAEFTNIMLNEGSTALPFEPYGIKIPISSANTTTPVYLGEVETTRRVRKWVLKGDEDGWFYSSGFVYNQNITPDYLRSSAQTVLCSHFKAIPNVTAGGNVGDGECALYSAVGVQRLYFRDSNYTTSASDFKTYLQQQYAAGTPVTVWYVLATPTTGIVNEPIRKIGDYADTVSGITIPTISGADSFDVLTTLKPSEVSANYHGWHTGTVHERESGQWD